MNKNLIIALGITLSISACNSADKNAESTTQVGEYFGEKIDTANAKPIADLVSMMGGADSLDNLTVEGTIKECCQKKGCWMKMELNNGETVRVSFKDYGFFVPKDASGKRAILHGIARMETTSLEDLKHYAKDAGKTQAQIDSIVAPETALTFEAKGVLIQ